MICKNCGTDNIDEALFCVGCGTPLKEPPKQEAPFKQGPKRRKKKLLLISGGVLLGAGVILALCLIFLRPDSRETLAENFVAAFFRRDSEMLESLTEPHFYRYLTEKGLGYQVEKCSAVAISTQTCTGDQEEAVRAFHERLDCDCPMTDLCTVEVEYTLNLGGYQSTNVADVTLGKGEKGWYVVDVE